MRMAQKTATVDRQLSRQKSIVWVSISIRSHDMGGIDSKSRYGKASSTEKANERKQLSFVGKAPCRNRLMTGTTFCGQLASARQDRTEIPTVECPKAILASTKKCNQTLEASLLHHTGKTNSQHLLATCGLPSKKGRPVAKLS